MILERRAVDPFFKNGFVIGCEETREGVVIDPGDEVDQLLEAAREHRLSILGILLTHAHLDHITGVAAAKRALGVPVWLHKDDNFLYERVVQQGQMFGLRVEPQPPVDHFYDLSTGLEAGLSTGLEAGLSTGLGLEGEGALRFGRYGVRVLHTPGHCPGGVCLAVSRLRGDAASARPARQDETASILFVGDTLFAGSIGRTDLPGGDLQVLLASIRNVLFAFPDDTVVWSGHGDVTTIGKERRTNPFLR
jgi:hydroxyacylglutathione hydrolase